MPTLVNPRPQPVRLHLSDGSERVVRAWGLAILPERAENGLPLEVLGAELLADQPARPAQSRERGAAERRAA